MSFSMPETRTPASLETRIQEWEYIKKKETSFPSSSVDHSSKSKTSSSKGKSYGFAILIIVGIGGLVVAGVSVSHYCGAISTLHQVHATIMIAVGGGSIFILLMIALVMKVRNYLNRIKPINEDFNTYFFIYTQRVMHQKAKSYLEKELEKIGAEVTFVLGTAEFFWEEYLYGSSEIHLLDRDIFSCKKVSKLDEEIQKDGKTPGQIVLYGIASRFNGTQSPGRFTIAPGKAVKTYKVSPSQWVNAQLQFPDKQVEIINNAANLGFNQLCCLLDSDTQETVSHGHFNLTNSREVQLVIDQLISESLAIEYLCVGNVPKGKGNTEKVYEILVGVPVFEEYSDQFSKITEAEKQEVIYLFALRSYSAQFKQAIKLAKENPNKTVILKPIPWELQCFGKDDKMVRMVRLGLYVAAKMFEKDLGNNKVSVQLQLFGWEKNALE